MELRGIPKDILYRLDFALPGARRDAEAVLEFGRDFTAYGFDATYSDGDDCLTVYVRIHWGMSEQARLVNSAGYLEILRVTAGPVELI